MGSRTTDSTVSCQLRPAITTRVRMSWTALDTTPDRVSEKARCAPITSLLSRLTSAPVRVRVKNAIGMVWTWSNTERRRSSVSPSPMRADQRRVTTAVTASAIPMAAIASASRNTIRNCDCSTIAVTTRPASSGVATARTAPSTDRTRKTTMSAVCGLAKTPILRKFSRVNTARSSRTSPLSDRIIARIADCCIVTISTPLVGEGARRLVTTTMRTSDLFRGLPHLVVLDGGRPRLLLDKCRGLVYTAAASLPNRGARQWHLPHLNRSEGFTMSCTEYIRHGGDEAAHEHHHHDPAVEPYPWSDAKRYLWLLGLIPAAGLFLSMPFVIGFNALGWGPAATAAWFLLPILVYVAIPLADLKV